MSLLLMMSTFAMAEDARAPGPRIMVCNVPAKRRKWDDYLAVFGEVGDGVYTAAEYSAQFPDKDLDKDVRWWCESELDPDLADNDQPNWAPSDRLLVLSVTRDATKRIVAVNPVHVTKVRILNAHDSKVESTILDVNDADTLHSHKVGRGLLVNASDRLPEKDFPPLTTVQVEVTIDDGDGLSTVSRYAELVVGPQLYSGLNVRSGFWVPGALASSDLGLSKTTGLRFVPLPVSLAWGGRLAAGESSYVGLSAFVNWTITGEVSTSKFNLQALSYGPLVDLNGVVYVGASFYQSFTDGGGPVPSLAVGFGPKALEFLK